MTTIAQGIISFEGDASGVTAAAAEAGKSIDSIGSKVKTLGNETGAGFQKVEEGAKGAAKATQTWNEYLKENIAEARKQFASQDLSKIEAHSAAVKKVSEQWKQMQKARESASASQAIDTTGIDNLTKAQDRLLNSIIRQSTVVTEGKAKWLELKAAQAGVSDQAAPYIAKLKAIDKTTNDLGISQGQLSAAMRGVPAQFTDIITSLQGGQQPLTVFLQQGGQLKDMFGGAGNAAKALGGYVLGLVNPFTVAAVAVGGLAYAYSQSDETAKRFQKTIIQTGNAAGVTSDQMIDLSNRVSAVGTGAANDIKDAVNTLVSTGKVSYGVLENATIAAVKAQDLLGRSVEDTAKEFENLGKSPTKSIVDLNDKYNFLTRDIYAQIKALEDQGKASEAAQIAQNAYADALISRSDKVKATLTDWERGWLRIKNAASDAGDSFLTMFDEDSNEKKIEKLFKKRDELEKAQSALSKGSSAWSGLRLSGINSELDQNKAEINAIRAKTDATKEAAKAKEAANKAESAAIEFSRQGTDYLTKAEKKQKEINAATQLYLAGSTEKNKRTAEDVELTTRLAKISEKYAETVKKTAVAQSTLTKEIDDKLRLSGLEITSEKSLSESQKLRLKLMDEIESGHFKVSNAMRLEQSKKIDLIKANELAKQSYENFRKEIDKFKPTTNTDDIIKGIQKQNDAYFGLVKTQEDYRNSLNDNAELMQIESNLMGQSATDRNTAIEQYKIELALKKELLKIDKDANLTQGEKVERSQVARENADLAKAQAAVKVQQQEWGKFYDDIYRGLTDSLYRGFEAGKGFFKSFWDSIRNLFKTTVLKIAVQGVMTGIAGGVPSLAQAFSGESAGAASSASSLFTMGKTIYEGFSGGFTGLGTAVTKYVQMGIDKAGLSMGSGAPSAFATGAGTAASYLGGAAAGIYGGRAISGGYSAFGGSGNSLVNVGTAAGAFFGGPIGAAIGGAIAGGINRLFGTKAPTLQSSELSGSFGASGVTANTTDYFKAKGGLFRSDKYSQTTTAVDTAGLTEQYNAIKDVAKTYANLLGLSTDSLATFSKSFTFNLSKTGDAAKDAEANQKLITDLFVGVSNDITNLLAPSISAFSKAGESTSQTLQRLATGLVGVNSVITSIGFAEFNKSLEGANAANRLAELTGGIENLASGAQYFFENFLTDAEKIKPSADLVTSTMARLGQSSVDTIEEFKSLVKGLDLATESGAKMYAELIAIAPQFKAVADYADQAAVKQKELIEAQRKKDEDVLKERGDLQEQLNSLTMSSSQLLAKQRESLDESNRALFDSINAVKAKQAADEEAARLAERIANERTSLQDQLDQITMTKEELLAKQRAGINKPNLELFDKVQAELAAKTLIDSIKQTNDSVQAQINDLIKSTMSLEDVRKAELVGLDASTVALKKRLYQLQDEASAQAKLSQAQEERAQAMKTELDNIRNFSTSMIDSVAKGFLATGEALIDTVKRMAEARDALIQGEQSGFSAAEKVSILRTKVSNATNDELPTIANEYLSALRESGVEGADYQREFAIIVNRLDMASSNAQRQYDEWNQTSQSSMLGWAQAMAEQSRVSSQGTMANKEYSDYAALLPKIKQNDSTITWGNKLVELMTNKDMSTDSFERLINEVKSLKETAQKTTTILDSVTAGGNAMLTEVG